MPGAAIAGILAILSFSFVATVPSAALAQHAVPPGRSDDTLLSGSRALAEGDSAAALAIWKAGLDDRFSVGLADAFVRLVFDLRRKDEYVLASETYLRMLEESDILPTNSAGEVLLRHASQMTFLLDDAWRLRFASDGQNEGTALRDGAGPLMAAWWRREDPLPATPWNERLIEHLERVSVARARYPLDRTTSGFDQRGAILVRLGRPDVTERLESRDLVRSAVLDPGIMPENELWVYRRFGDAGLFLFVREGGYRLASPLDLMPPNYRLPFNTYGYPGRTAIMAYGLYEFYEALSRYSPRHMPGVHMLGDIRDRQRETSLQTGTPLPLLLRGGAPGLSKQQYAELRADEFRFRRQRDEALPLISTEVGGSDPLPVDARIARFLNDDGSTRTEIYWTASDLKVPTETSLALLKAGRIPTNEHLLRFTAVQFDSLYRRRTLARGQVHVRADAPRVSTAIFERMGAPFAAALQIDQYVVLGEQPDDVAFVRSGTFKRDSLHPLDADPTAIEMSDVVLFRNGDPTDRVVRAAPNSIDSLGIYFELYHLSYGDDDLVHYEIQYAVEVRSRRSPFSGILGRPRRKTVTGSVRHSGGSSTIKEQILLDLVGADESDVVELNVTATDLITGRSKARSISVSSPDRKNTSRAGTRN